MVPPGGKLVDPINSTTCECRVLLHSLHVAGLCLSLSQRRPFGAQRGPWILGQQGCARCRELLDEWQTPRPLSTSSGEVSSWVRSWKTAATVAKWGTNLKQLMDRNKQCRKERGFTNVSVTWDTEASMNRSCIFTLSTKLAQCSVLSERPATYHASENRLIFSSRDNSCSFHCLSHCILSHIVPH